MNLASARQSIIDLHCERHSQVEKGEQKNRLGKAAARPNSHNLTERGIAEACLNFPDRSIPKRFQSAGATKGCYRLLSRTNTQRWIIEEYHKCLKTGCKMEEAQLRTADHLMNLFGILGVIETQLVQLRDLSRSKGSEPADAHVDKMSVKLIVKIFKLTIPPTLKEFWRRVAMLGGFLGRKSDGNPGWQTLWFGWLRLRDMCKGAELVEGCRTC